MHILFCDLCHSFLYSIYKCIANAQSFSCGYSFFYWPGFERNVQTDFPGRYDYYYYSNLFIKKNKYKNLKEVISNRDNEFYGGKGIKMLNEMVISKSQQLIDTEQVKSIRLINGC